MTTLHEAPEAPCHYDNQQASAWQSGWNAAVATLAQQGEPVAWLGFDQTQEVAGKFPWMLMVNEDHPLIKVKTAKLGLYTAAPAAQQGEQQSATDAAYSAGFVEGERAAIQALSQKADELEFGMDVAAPAAQPQDDRLEGALRIQMKRNGQWQDVTKMEEVVNTAEYRRGIRDACEQFAMHDGNTYADMVLEHFNLLEK